MAWLGEGDDVVPYRASRLVALDEEPLLPALGMVRQRPVGKTVAHHRAVLVHNVDDAAGVEPPDAENVGQDAHHLADLYRCEWRTRLDPFQAKMVPSLQGSPG